MYACDIPSTRPLRPLVPFHISKRKHPHHCISRGGERQLTYGKAIERKVLLESDCSCDSSETLNKLNLVLEFPKRDDDARAYPPPMMTTDVVSSVSGRSASEPAPDDCTLQDVISQ